MYFILMHVSVLSGLQCWLAGKVLRRVGCGDHSERSQGL